ncbi:hypothetical protein K457DRAFT_140190 [Linnemannia elongata AG-77]|uniref:Uncharacterized protein n=1 Tax=Linnemannia elongata AG-77 TaxID=1314771 RepID=A0A197JQX4_9FUNG|nr:hypothetical protein K457DRAFT_140190 [Linnemannia elongata AG-77]
MADTTTAHQVNPASSIDTAPAPNSDGTNKTTTTTTYIQPQPIDIPGSSSSSTANNTLADPNSNSQAIISPNNPSKSVGKKTGTRSTFCPNTLRKCTKLTDEDFDHHEKDNHSNHAQSTGWLGMLGLKKSANYDDELCKYNEPHEQAYY